MKKLQALKIFLFAMIMTLAVSGTALAGSQDFTLVNGTGQIIREVYLSPTKSSEWIYQDELAKNQVLYPGQDIFLAFDPRDNVQYWDIKVVYEDGSYEYWYTLDLFRIYRITIRPNAIATIDEV